MIIAFSGVDGSGKTTIAKKLKDVLEHRNPGVPVVYKHVSQYFLLQPFINLFNNKPKRTNENKFLNIKKKPAIFKLWVIVAFLDFLFFYIYLKIISFRKIVICDRYVYDRFLGLRYFGYSSERIEHLLLNFIPIEHLFILQLSPKWAMLREMGDSHSLQFFSTMSAWFLGMLKVYPRIVSVNAEQRIDVIVDKVLNILSEDLNKL